MNKYDIIKTISLTAAEKKALADCDAKLQRLYKLHDQYRDPYESRAQGESCELWDKICETATAVENDPCEETMRRHLDVMAEVDLVNKNRAGLRDLGTRARDRAREAHKHVMVSILNRAIAQVDREAASRREAAESAGFGPQLDVLAGSLRSEFENDKSTGNPSAWLADHGFLD